MRLLTTTGIIIFENDKPTLKETISDAVQSGIKNMDNINLSNQTLIGIDLSGLSLNGAFFKGADVRDSNFQGCFFEWAYFTFASFDKCNFSKSELIDPYLANASFIDCSFRDSKIKGQTPARYEASIFSGSDMTGIQMYKIIFAKSDFRNVLMQQSVLHHVNFEDCCLSDMSLQKSVLYSVRAGDRNLGNIITTGIVLANEDCEIKGFAGYSDLEFLQETFKIDPENKITVYRHNYGKASPYIHGHLWNYDSKAVSTKSGYGIYGYTPEMSGCIIISIGKLKSNFTNKRAHTVDILNDSQVIIELEVDKHKVLYKNDHEIAFSECNIVGIISPEYFISKNYQQCSELLDLYNKAMESPDLYESQYLEEYNKQFNYYSNLAEKITTSDLQIRQSQLEIIKNYAINHAIPSDVHGLSHWRNVERNAILLAEKTGVDTHPLRVFAYIHDMCRENDGGDPEHGLRASKVLKKYMGTFLNGMDDIINYKLCFACENHTRILRTGDLLIDSCFDADRLDLLRIGIKPDPDKMATEYGAYLAANPDIFEAEIRTMCV